MRAFLRTSEIAQGLGVLPTPAKMALTPAAKRQATKPAAWMLNNPVTTVKSENVFIDSRGGPLQIRLYKPNGWVAGGPGLLYVHGGGFYMGGLDGCDDICRKLSDRAGVVIASVEYRLCPEDKFPAALEDCEDALLWLLKEQPHGIDAARVGIAGDSAGGNLTASLAVHLRDSGGPQVLHQALIYPLVDAYYRSPSWRECAGGGVDVAAGAKMMAFYAGDRQDDPLVGALAVEDLAGLPPALVVTADYDVLRDEGIRYAERLLEAGVATKHLHYMGKAHGFLSTPRLYRDADQAFTDIASAIRAALHV